MTSTRLTRAVIDLACLERNWLRLRDAHARGRIVTVLKANAYGHGLVPVARFLQGLRQDHFAVAFLDEALALRHAGITGRILVLGPPEPGTLPLYGRHRIEASIPSLDLLREAIAVSAQGPLEVQLKCDTGMGRVGLRDDALADLREILKASGDLIVRGLFSHFAEAEDLASDFTERQHAAFERWCSVLSELLPGTALERHLANSAGLMRDTRYHYDYARVGFALWAAPVFSPGDQAPEAARAQEQPLTLRTNVTQVKMMSDGESVGYNRNYRATAGEHIATLPIGHGDGYFRALGNRGFVVIGGKRRPVVGNVSMDQTTVSLGTDSGAPGEEALLLGGGPDGISAAELGSWAGTIDYEVFTHLAARLPREYVYNGTPIPEP